MCDFKSLKESILDVPQKNYCEEIFTKDNKLKKEVINQILDTIENWKKQINFDFEIKKILAKGSLLSKRYTETSDLDISIVVDMTEDQINSIIDIVPKGLNIEGSSHPLDFYVIKEGEEPSEKNADNIYDVKNDKWLKRTEEYDNPIPLDYTIQVCNFFINGCDVALRNFNDDKILYQYYEDLNPETHEIEEDELQKVLEDKRRDLTADLDALRVALHMISSFRHESYEETSTPFNISLEVVSNNPHTTLNENFVKLLEKFGVREALRSAVKECKEILKKDSECLEEEVLDRFRRGRNLRNFYDFKSKKTSKSIFSKPFDNEKTFKESLNLKEDEVNSSAAFCFGRNNPPTIGHLLLWEETAKAPTKDHFIYTSHTQDKKKNPLDYDTKTSIIEKCIEDYHLNIQFINTEARTYIDVLVDLYKKGYKNIVVVAGKDRLEELLFLARKYNDVPNKEGIAYHFDSIEGHEAGDRDPDSEGVNGISGTKMRDFIREGNFEEFQKYFPLKKENIAKQVFDKAASYLGC